MDEDKGHVQLLQTVLDQIVENNRTFKPGSPMAELKSAIEAALGNLPPLEFDSFNQALEDQDAAERLLRRAPEMIGWDADQIVEWVEEIAGKLSAKR